MYKAAPRWRASTRCERAARRRRRAGQGDRQPSAAKPSRRPIRDFYLTNPIARASAVMAEMSALKKPRRPAPRLKAAE